MIQAIIAVISGAVVGFFASLFMCRSRVIYEKGWRDGFDAGHSSGFSRGRFHEYSELTK